MVHRREVDGQEVVLGNHGALWGNAMTWWDHGTGSIWSQPLGEAILGPLAGARLELLSSTLTTWEDWLDLHPDSLAMEATNERLRHDLDQMVIVVEFGENSAAFPVTELRREGVANHGVAGAPIAVVADPLADHWAVFSRRLDDGVVELELVAGELLEVDGDAAFALSDGQAIRGDESLDLLPGFTSFARDYETFFPSGEFWTAEGVIPVE